MVLCDDSLKDQVDRGCPMVLGGPLPPGHTGPPAPCTVGGRHRTGPLAPSTGPAVPPSTGIPPRVQERLIRWSLT
ncbi:hypothetical protein ACFVJI_11470, partial [Streptomyces sp. NPDC127584]